MLPERPETNRRDWIRQVLQTAGGSVLGVALSAQEHSHETGSTEAPGKPGEWRPAFLTPEQNEALVSLGECIVPGSAAALCNRVIDLILTLESDKTKRQTLDALAKFDGAARHGYGVPFQKLRPEQQAELLTAATEHGGQLNNEFQVIKEWIADAYWSSKDGMRELGWKGRVAWSSFGNVEPCSSVTEIPAGDEHR
jgi:Gluconate 2-dehydrogenase subunit 3